MAQWASDLTEARLQRAICARPPQPPLRSQCQCGDWLLTSVDVSGTTDTPAVGGYIQLVGGTPVGQPALFVATSSTVVALVAGATYSVKPIANGDGKYSTQAVTPSTWSATVFLTWEQLCD